LVAIDDDEEDNGEDDEAPEKEVALSGCVLVRERIGDDALEDWLSDDAVMPASAEEESSAPGCAASFSALSTSCSKI
jgi:hypothetical protein